MGAVANSLGKCDPAVIIIIFMYYKQCIVPDCSGGYKFTQPPSTLSCNPLERLASPITNNNTQTHTNRSCMSSVGCEKVSATETEERGRLE